MNDMFLTRLNDIRRRRCISIENNGCKPNGLQFWMVQRFLPSDANLRLAFSAEKMRLSNNFIPLGMILLVEKQSSPVNLHSVRNATNCKNMYKLTK